MSQLRCSQAPLATVGEQSVEVKHRSWETRAEVIARGVVMMQVSSGWILGVF